MEEKYLPIGSVCTLKGKNKKVMITGYYSVEFNGNLRIKDYCGCVYPEGMLLPEQNCTFNHTDIEVIDFIGLQNDEYQTFKKLLDRLTGNDLSEEEKVMQFHKDNDMFLTSNSTYSKLLFDENGVVMIADTVVQTKEDQKDYKFDTNGIVINVVNQKDIKNPFYKEYNEPIIEENRDWKIFNKVEFDTNGTVISAEANTFEENAKKLNKIEFDENGVVVSVNADILKEQKYEFDENGTLIAVDSERLEDEAPPIGPGLTGYVEPSNKKTSNYKFDSEGNVVTEETYEFDPNGNLVSISTNEKEEEVPPIGPGLPGYVEPKNKKASNYKFDSEGNVVTEETYEFDPNGNLVSISTNEKEEEVPPIGPGLPGYVEPKNKKASNYKFDSEGNVVTEETYEFDPNGNLVSISTNEKEEEVPPIGPGLPGYVEPKQESKYVFDANGTVVETN